MFVHCSLSRRPVLTSDVDNGLTGYRAESKCEVTLRAACLHTMRCDAMRCGLAAQSRAVVGGCRSVVRHAGGLGNAENVDADACRPLRPVRVRILCTSACIGFKPSHGICLVFFKPWTRPLSIHPSSSSSTETQTEPVDHDGVTPTRERANIAAVA
jgi:hypothetical protein